MKVFFQFRFHYTQCFIVKFFLILYGVWSNFMYYENMQHYVYDENWFRSVRSLNGGDTHGRELSGVSRLSSLSDVFRWLGHFHFMFVHVVGSDFFNLSTKKNKTLFRFRSSRRVNNRKRRSVFHDFVRSTRKRERVLSAEKKDFRVMKRAATTKTNVIANMWEVFRFMLRPESESGDVKETKYVTDIHYAIFFVLFYFSLRPKSIQHDVALWCGAA